MPPATEALAETNSDFDFHKKIQDFTAQVEAENARGPDDNDNKRKLYVESELLRMDYEELADVQPFLTRYRHASTNEEKQELEKSIDGKRVLRTLSEFDALRKSLDIPYKHLAKPSVETYVRMVILFTYILICIPVMTFFAPFLYLHPLFLKYGLHRFQPVDVVNRWFGRGFLFLCGITVSYESMEYMTEGDSGIIGMFTHASNLDPLLAVSGPVAFKFITKKQLFKIPIIGWLLKAYGHIPIDRTNLELAKISLARATELIRNYRRSIAISPEGTRSKTGRLAEFKKGPFHTALDVRLPVVPILLTGAFELWPPQSIFPRSGHVTVRYLPAIRVKPDDTYNSFAARVRREILKGTLLDSSKLNKSSYWLGAYCAFFPLCYIAAYGLYRCLMA